MESEYGLRCRCCNNVLTRSELIYYDTLDAMCRICIIASEDEYDILTDKEYMKDDLFTISS